MPNYSIITARTLALTIYWAYSDLSNFHLYSAVFLWVSVLSRSVVLTLCKPMDCSLPGSSVHGDSPGKNTGVDCHALLQGIFPTQGSNPGLPHCSRILYQLINQGSLLWVSSSIQFCPLCGSVNKQGTDTQFLHSTANSFLLVIKDIFQIFYFFKFRELISRELTEFYLFASGCIRSWKNKDQ